MPEVEDELVPASEQTSSTVTVLEKYRKEWRGIWQAENDVNSATSWRNLQALDDYVEAEG